MTKLIFWISAIYIAYTYAGYPLIIYLWAKLFPRRVRKSPLDEYPPISIIISARNEETNIRRRIENLLAQDYPQEMVEIIVISDGSTDSTEDIVKSLIEEMKSDGRGSDRLILITHEVNSGKPTALNAGMEIARGDFIVFTDARQEFEPGAVRELIDNFSDPDVGTVTGELVFHDTTDTTIKAEMGLYWNLEKWIRKTESQIHSVAGATGAIYAVRKELAAPIPAITILDDVLIPMRGVSRGYRTVFEKRAVAWDHVSRDLAHEKSRKVRTLLGNYQLLQIMPELLSPRKNPIFFQFVSHKFLRLLVPFFFFSMLLSAAATGDAGYILFFAACIVFLATPLLEKYLGGSPAVKKLASISKTFSSLNYFAFLAFLTFIRPGEKEVW